MSDFQDFSNLDQSYSIKADPSRYSFLRSLNISDDVVRRLSLHLDRIVTGSDEVFLTPIGKDNDPSVVLSNFDKLFENNIALMNKDLINLELSNKSKYGPRSISKPWVDRKKSLTEYYKSVSTNSPSVQKLESGSLRPISIDSGIKLLKNNTNSGLPYYTRKSKVKEKLKDKFVYLLEQKYPCILFTRTQEGNKTRNVWGYPIADTLNELLYYSPLLDYQRRLGWRSALLGPELVDRSVTSLISNADKLGRKLLSVDFSAYDSSVNSNLQLNAFNYISSLFQSQFSEDINELFVRFNSIGIITPHGIMNGKHGVPSGSTFTNEVDSIVQYIIAREILPDNMMQIQGDDGAYSVEESNIQPLFDSFKHYGLNINVDKSYISDSFLIYLQKLYHKEYLKDGLIGGIYPVYRALCRIIFQERYSDFEDYDIKGKDYYSIRTISILENCKYHPLFPELVKFVYKLDKYSLSYTQQAKANYFRMIAQGPGAGGLLVNQYGDRINGIDSFATVKLINTFKR